MHPRPRILLALVAGITLMAAAIATAQNATPDGLCCLPGSDNPVSDARPAAKSATAKGNIVLDFEGLGDLEPVEQFYNGGLGGDGSGPGPDFGITFSDNALAIIDADAGGGGNFGGEPSPDTILFFLTGTAATMNVPGGFQNGFSFFYSAINNTGTIVVYDGVDATGNVLATLDLPLTPNNGAPDPTGAFSPLEPIGVSFTGTARSVDFGGTIDQIGFDNITLGTDEPVGGGGGGPPPEPGPENIPVFWGFGAMLLAGLLGLLGFRRLR